MRILHVDACGLTTGQARLILGRDGSVYEATGLMEEGLDLARIYDYDAIITETDLPDGTGLRLVRRLREGRISTPVLVLSGHAEVETRVEYLRTGADDFLAKPHHPTELLIRIQSLVRRSRGHASPVVTIGTLSMNMSEKTVSVGDQRIHLTGKEYQMLELMIMRLGQTLSKEAFLNHLYGGRDEPELKIIDVFICKLRKKLARVDPSAGRMIETVWGRGYAVRRPERPA